MSQSGARRKKIPYKKGSSHKVLENVLNQKFEAEKINEKWVSISLKQLKGIYKIFKAKYE